MLIMLHLTFLCCDFADSHVNHAAIPMIYHTAAPTMYNANF